MSGAVHYYTDALYYGLPGMYYFYCTTQFYGITIHDNSLIMNDWFTLSLTQTMV